MTTAAEIFRSVKATNAKGTDNVLFRLSNESEFLRDLRSFILDNMNTVSLNSIVDILTDRIVDLNNEIDREIFDKD